MEKSTKNDYGILPNTGIEQTQQLQQALDECAQLGATLCIEPGEYQIGTLTLPSGTSLHIKRGATLLGSSEFERYTENQATFVDAVGHKRGRCLLLAKDAQNIHIFGHGTVNGRGGLFLPPHPHYLERPFLVRIIRCQNVRLDGLQLTDAAGWCLHILDSDQVQLQRLNIRSRCNDNNDGIDVDSSSNVLIEHCMVDTGDDALCLKSTTGRPCKNVTIRNCAVSSDCSAFKIGTESVGDFESIRLEHCLFYDVNCCAIKIVPTDGAQVRDVSVEDVRMCRCTGPIFVSVGRRLREYFGVRRVAPGGIEGLLFKNIVADCVDAQGHLLNGSIWGNGKSCVVLSGETDAKIRGVHFENCSFWMQGGQPPQPPRSVPKMGAQYPEFHLLGELPAWGLFAQDVCGLTLGQTVEFFCKHKDGRPKLVLERVENSEVEG